jgi:2-C-methyl-D-erythritol 4-phosphate cytidylyltransferase/2-C-methyl-D-erythritol 2,4-cyclodiphosphate synthase
VRRGLEALPEDLDVVLVHDAARPFVDPALIDRVIEAAVRTGAAVPAVQAKDTVKRVRAGEVMVAATIAREEIWLAQTPQGFRRSVIVAATALGETGIDATDEAMLAERAGYQVEVVAGDDANVKITTKDDLETARRAIAGVPRVGTGYDLHRLVEGRPLVLAGVTIPSERGPLGHSDGDVVCHAVVDAMFGAAGVGDIGQHFPDSDPRWRGAAGLDLLGRAARIVAEAGWRATNVDVTVVLERPKLAPHVASIRACVADVLELEVSQVSVKGKTNETVDAVGRSEAIASHAVVCLAARRAAG